MAAIISLLYYGQLCMQFYLIGNEEPLKLIKKGSGIGKASIFINNHEENVGRYRNVKSASDEISERHEKHVNGNCRKVDPFYKVANITCPNCVLFYGK